MKRGLWRTISFPLLAITMIDFALPPSANSQTAKDSTKKPIVHSERLQDRAAANRRWFGARWTAKYRQFLYQRSLRQRGIFPRTFRLQSSTLRATLLPPLPPGTCQNLGPRSGGFAAELTDSGRLSQIVPHPTEPDTIFAVAAEGGLWKTVDGGASWTFLTDELGTQALGALAIDPAQPTTLYLGLGDVDEREYGGTGTGIVKSVDNGKTWSSPVLLGDSFYVTSIFVLDSTHIFAGTDQGLFASSDQGDTFHHISNDKHPFLTIRDITRVDSSTLLLSSGDNYYDAQPYRQKVTIFYSPDRGTTWIPSSGLDDGSTVLRYTLAVAPSNHHIVYAVASTIDHDFGGLYRSTSAGRSWSKVADEMTSLKNPDASYGRTSLATLFGDGNSPIGGYAQALLVDPRDPNVVMIGGDRNLVRSADAGATFSIVSDCDMHQGLPYVHADFHCGAIDRLGNLWIGSDGGLAKSPDGLTWSTAPNVNLVTHLLYGVAWSAGAPSTIAAALQDNGTRVGDAASGGFPQVFGGDGMAVLLNRESPAVLLTAEYFDYILRSADGGRTLERATEGIAEADNDQRAPFHTKLVADPSDPTGNTVVTFANQVLYRSTNFGISWIPFPVTLLGAGESLRGVAVSRSLPGMVAVITDGGRDRVGRVLLSRDGGQTWVPTGVLPDSHGDLSSIAFGATDAAGTLYVSSVAAASHGRHLWRSTNGGASWIPVDGSGLDLSFPINCVEVDPSTPGVIYVGTHVGLYRSTDGGDTWSRYGSGFPAVSVTAIAIATDSSVVRVATYGRGLWELHP